MRQRLTATRKRGRRCPDREGRQIAGGAQNTCPAWSSRGETVSTSLSASPARPRRPSVTRQSAQKLHSARHAIHDGLIEEVLKGAANCNERGTRLVSLSCRDTRTRLSRASVDGRSCQHTPYLLFLTIVDVS